AYCIGAPCRSGKSERIPSPADRRSKVLPHGHPEFSFSALPCKVTGVSVIQPKCSPHVFFRLYLSPKRPAAERSGTQSRQLEKRDRGDSSMAWNSKVVWSEGMFLRPQHFQQQDRFMQFFAHA